MNEASALPADIPPGFRLIAWEGVTFNSTNGPFYLKHEEGDVALGFRVEQRHCNPAGILHGGMMMTLADMTSGFGTSIKAGIDKFMPTVNMTFDFVASGKIGDWVEGRCEVLKVTRSLAFASVMLTTSAGPLLRASAVLKIPSGEGLRWKRAPLIG